MELGTCKSPCCDNSLHHILWCCKTCISQSTLALITDTRVLPAHHSWYSLWWHCIWGWWWAGSGRRQGSAQVYIRHVLSLPAASDHPRGLLVPVQHKLLQQHSCHTTAGSGGNCHQLSSHWIFAPSSCFTSIGLHLNFDNNSDFSFLQYHLCCRSGIFKPIKTSWSLKA